MSKRKPGAMRKHRSRALSRNPHEKETDYAGHSIPKDTFLPATFRLGQRLPARAFPKGVPLADR
jgi:hypothetical protein